MGQKPAEPACGDAEGGKHWDESVLILIRHCRDMKRQETYLRLITLLLLLSCSALYLFVTCIHGAQETATAAQQRSTAWTSAAHSRQERPSADDPETTFQHFHMQLIMLHQANKSEGQYLKWQLQFSQPQSCNNGNISIPQPGVYFVFVSFSLGCHPDHKPGPPALFFAELHKWNPQYPQTENLAGAKESLTCSPEGFRTVSVERLFDLMAGDSLSVWINFGYKLIITSSFGAYRVH